MPRLPLLLALLLSAAVALGQGDYLRVVTWNIRDLGRSKSDEEIELMARLLRGHDIIAIQEVVAGDKAGARAVARLAAALDRKGADYDYRVSDPTQSSSGHIRERYAFLWRTSTVRLLGRPELLSAFAKTVEREPYLAQFEWAGRRLRVANFHARPHDQQPEREIARFKTMPDAYPDAPLLLLGDFNVPSHHTVFHPWVRRGYQVVLAGQPTTLRRKVPEAGEDVYYHESDNILVPAHQVRVWERGILDVVGYCKASGYASEGGLAMANALSDHAPVYVVVSDF